MEKRLTMIIAGLFLLIGSALAQAPVSGTVVSADDGQPVIGASVKVVGTKGGTVTDLDGKFSLSMPAGHNKLYVTSIGMVSKTVTVKGNTVNIILETDATDLDEVVVTGYGSAKKLGSVVGAVSTVGGSKLEKMVTPNFTDALAGQVSGLSVLSSAGDPSTSATIRLRGVNSINSSNQPLYILDGSPITSALFSNLNPADIANITVLKDAASTAIYGSRAANGVIVITSRQGKYNETASLTVRAQYGISSPTSDGADMMNSEEYIQFRDLIGQPVSDEVRNLVNNYGISTDWYDEMLDSSAPTYDLNATLQGGGNTMNYYLSYNYHDQDGLIEKSAMQRSTINARLNARLNKYFKVGFNSMLGVHEYQQNSEWADTDNIYLANPMVFARMALPYDTPYYYSFDDDGNLIKGDRAQTLKYSGITTPWWVNKNRTQERKNVTLNMSLNEQLTPIEGLFLTAQQSLYGYDYTLDATRTPYDSFTTPMGSTVSSQSGSAQKSFQRYYAYTLTHTAEYRNSFGKHNINVLLGQESRIIKNKVFGVYATGQTDARRLRLIDATTVSVSNLTDTSYEQVYNSWFGNAEYNYDERYYVYASLRRDGSSKFAPGHRWGTFWSAGVKWNAKRETFLRDVSWLDELSLSVNYGTTGNDAGADSYDYLGLFGTGSNYNGESSIGIAQASNSELTWETVAKLNFGLNFRVFDRLGVDFNVYRNKTTDMLMEIPYSFTTGFESGAGNIGAMTNTGFELTANVDILKTKDFRWTFTANVGYNKNKITELFAGRDEYVISNTGIKLQVGKAYGEYYLVRYAGVDPRTGEPQYYDKDGNITKVYNEEENAVFTGKQRFAPWIGGFGTSFQWKGLSISADFTWQSGKYMQINDNYFTENANMGTTYNQTTRMLNVWTTPGQITDVPAYGYDVQFDDHLLYNASFLRMKNLTIQYEFPKKWMKTIQYIQDIKVFGIARNLFTITPFEGYDPEPDTNLVQFNYPNTRQFVVGLELTF